MPPDSCVEFTPFRLDLVNQELWRGAERVPLRAKPFAVLAYLATHPARLVQRAELVAAVWPDTHVGEGLLRGYVRELRAVLGDDAAAPRFIETVTRRGYRFVAPIRSGAAGASPEHEPAGAAEPTPSTATVVGRKAELAELERRFAEAAAGKRRLVFVSGEAGIGKTTLVDTFVRGLRVRGIRVARGQCLEHFGAGEPHLPLLEALAGLCRLPRGRDAVAVLARHAPTWLVEMPALVPDAELDAARRRAQGATRERMLREFAESIEVLAAAEPLVLVLEDLQWSDRSTLDVLSSLARRREPARFLVLGTVRTADVTEPDPPLERMRHELHVHGLASELALPPLGAEEVAEYVVARFPREPLAPHFGRSIHQATEGNALFVVTLLEAWARSAGFGEREEGAGAARLHPGGPGVPETLRQMIGQPLDRLPAEARRMLEAASVVGAEFSTASVAAALEEREEAVDERCAELARRGLFLRACGVEAGAAGHVAGRYAFLHALHRQVLYEGLSATRRARLHRRIAAWQESAYGALAHEHAAELAVHFEKGHDAARALRYLGAAARNAMRRHAYHEAAVLLARALDSFARLPDAEADPQQELSLRMALGTALLTTRGYAAPEVHAAYARAHELCRRLEEGPELAFALAGLFRFFFVGGAFQRARELAAQVLRIAERHRALLPVAHSLAGLPLLAQGEFSGARFHLEQAIALYDFERHRSLATEHGDDPALTSLGFLAIVLWFVGQPDAALARIREAQALAERLATPYGVAFAHSFTAWLHVRRGEAALAQARCDALLRLTAEQGFAFFAAEGAIFRGFALVEQGRSEAGLRQLQEGLAAHRAAGTRMGRPPHLALLAEACARAGRPEAGLAVLDEAFALVEETGERSSEAELHRLRGELLEQRAGNAGERAEADACLRRAADLARRQGARALELRALVSLVRSAGARRGEGDARRRLRELADSFTEGLDTADLRAARSLSEARPARGG